MKVYGIFNICALIASIVVLAIAYVLVPEQSWTIATKLSIAIFAITVGFFFVSPSLIRKKSENSASEFAGIGPISVLAGCLLILSTAAVILALTSFEKLSISISILTIGFLLIALLTLRVAMNVIDQAAEKSSLPSAHKIWQGQIQMLNARSQEPKTKQLLNSLSEKLRYLANDVPGGSPFDDEINALIQNLNEQLNVQEKDVIESSIKKIEGLLYQREIFLRSARNKV